MLKKTPFTNITNDDNQAPFALDKFGRIVIQDSDLLEVISGAICSGSDPILIDSGCGCNNNCTNQSC